MKYKVIKSIPGYSEGDIIDEKGLINVGYWTFSPKDFPDFFQQVEEKRKTVWELKDGDKFFFICGDGLIDFNYFPRNISYIESGNAFLTAEEAEKEVEKRELITKLLRSKHEMGLNKEFVKDERNYYIFLEGNILSMSYEGVNSLPILGYFSKESQEYIDKNKEDLLRLFELTK